MNLRTRLLAIVVVAMLPASIAIAWREQDLHAERENELRQDGLQQSRQIAAELARIVDGSQQLLTAVSNTQVVQELAGPDFSAVRCTATMQRMLRPLVALGTMTLLDASGTVVCGPGISVQAGDRPFFFQAMQTGEFAIGEYAIGRVSGVPVLHLGVPVLGEGGRRLGVIGAGMKLSWLQQQLRLDELPEGSVIVLLDRNGVLLARVPAGDPAAIGKAAVGHWQLTAGGTGKPAARSEEQLDRLISFSPVRVGGSEVMHVGVGILRAPAIAAIHEQIHREIGIAAGALLAALALTWLLADRSIRRPIVQLSNTISAWSTGDLSARADVRGRNDEIGRLGQSFNAMGESLVQRTHQLRSSQQNEESIAARLRIADRAMSASAVPMLLVDAVLADQPITYVNPAFERETGYTAAESIGRNCRFLQAEGGSDEQQRGELRRALQENREAHVLLKNRRKDGFEYMCEVHTAPVYDTRGKLTHFFGMLHNVSSRIRAEQAAESATSLLVQLLESTTDAVVALDHDYKVTYVNERAAARLYDGRDLIGLDLRTAFAPSADAFLERYETAMATGVAASFEAFHPRMEAWLEVHAHPNNEGIAIFFRDITQRRENEATLIEAREEALAASQAKSNFLATMSHELRTPLNAVIGFAEMIANGSLGPIDPHYQEYGTDIGKAGMHLLHVINDVLDVSKIEAGRVQLNDRTLHLSELAKSCAGLLRANAAERRIKIELDCPDDIVVMVDAVRMRQALLNLLSNAVKFSVPGGTVRIGSHLNDKGAPCITVADSGIGMKPADVQIALQPFRQLENAYSRTYEGTGLGLPIAARLIELHGGDLSIDSVPGQGTMIELCLPVERLVSVNKKIDAASQDAIEPPSS